MKTKKTKWLEELNGIDEKYIEEADPDAFRVAKRSTNRPRRRLFGALAACVCGVIAIGTAAAVLFVPFKTNADMVAYKGDPYYGVIRQLHSLTYEKPKYKNNYEKLTDNVSNFFSDLFGDNKSGGDLYFDETNDAINKGEIVGRPIENDFAPGGVKPGDPGGIEPGAADNDKYHEITDNQVQGVTEADLIKRSDKYIYYLDCSNMVLRVYDIAKADTRMVGSYSLKQSGGTSQTHTEFYLSSDCKTATIFLQYNSRQTLVKVISLDVSDPTNIKERSAFAVTGNYISSRMTNGNFLLFSQFRFNYSAIDYDDRSTFLPCIDTGDGLKPVPADKITVPDTLNDTRYTVVTMLDEKTLELKGCEAYLSYSENAYVSKNRVYLTHVYKSTAASKDEEIEDASFTRISVLGYNDGGFDLEGDVTVRGYVKDQYSLDEYTGTLRVVTTVNSFYRYTVGYGSWMNGQPTVSQLTAAYGKSNASLYCIDTESWEIVASVERFAPDYDEVRSVRFDGDMAYVCTAIEVTDPVYFFDLSDLNNITYKDTGTIAGFSSSLINFGNGYLLGIGKNSEWSFKAEIYEEVPGDPQGELSVGDPTAGVRSVCVYSPKGYNTYSEDYKSYYVDRENQLVGLALTDLLSSDPASTYIVLHFNGYTLEEVAHVRLIGTLENFRGAYIDGYMYIFADEAYKVVQIFNA